LLGAPIQLLLAATLVGTSLATSYELLRSDRQRFAVDSPVNWVRAWGLGNVFHIFPNMQTERQELVIEGSHDGIHWHAYDFRYKPDFAGDAPSLVMPLHPRLDWMMWFVPQQSKRDFFWFNALLYRLKNNEPDVTALFKHNPFANKPPRHLRVMAYAFRFSTPMERQTTGNVWQTRLLGQFPQVKPRLP